MNTGKKRGFTLIEILVVIAIIAVLVSLLLPVLKNVRDSGKMARELNAARQIIGAYGIYPTEHNGDLMPGYDKDSEEVTLPSGKTLSGEMCCRYPWRLAPYLAEQVEDIFLLNDTKKYTNGKAWDSFDYQYRASLNPALGINAYCVGGYNPGGGSTNYTADVVRRAAAASRPSNLIVFASARMKIAGTQDSEVTGNFLVTPPKLGRARWSATYDPKAASANFGNVAMRWDDQAICAFLDGHVALLAEKELRDMRHWSNAAAEADDPNFSVPQ